MQLVTSDAIEEMLGRKLSCETRLYAHTPARDSVKWHTWPDHSTSVSNLAGEFGVPFGAGAFCRLIGLTHDAGKLTEIVQQMLQLRAIDHGPRLGEPHKWEGAALAGLLLEAGNIDAARIMALANFGHHHHIPDETDLKGILRFMRRNPHFLDELVDTIEAQTNTDLRKLAASVELPSWIEKPSDLELFTRMCHSALVDADFLDTEAHFKALPNPRRSETHGMDTLLTAFEAAYHHKYAKRRPVDRNELEHLRWDFFYRAQRIGAEPPASAGAIYRLPAPTGCGKTMAAAEFALTHAACFGKRRVIVAVPFTSITTQNAQAYREMFQALGGEIVLEHHSNILDERIADDEWRRFSSANWDAEFIVTTTVQLFESLFSNRPSATRKLHRLVDSVVVIDEVQSLPIDLLPAILRMLRELSTHYGVTFLLASATQPAFWSLDEWADLQMRELMPIDEVPPVTERVTYDVRGYEQTWEEIADEASAEEQALVVANTTAHAQRLHALITDRVGDRTALHLSARMYNGHRAEVLDEIRHLLKSKKPVILVSTQLIEAGVDIDFPVVFRALAPADSIVQSAGRCNREGDLGVRGGRVVVFHTADSDGPKGRYTRATNTTRNLFVEQAARAAEQGREPNSFKDPASIEDYYHHLYAGRLTGVTDVTGARVNRHRKELEFEQTHKTFKMMEQTTVAVIVNDGSDQELRLLVDRMRTNDDYIIGRRDRRLLNRFTASAPQRQPLRQPGLFEQLPTGALLWAGEYDERVGLVLQAESGVTIW